MSLVCLQKGSLHLFVQRFSESSWSLMHLQSVAYLHLLLYCDLEARSRILITFKNKSLKRSDDKCFYIRESL